MRERNTLFSSQKNPYFKPYIQLDERANARLKEFEALYHAGKTDQLALNLSYYAANEVLAFIENSPALKTFCEIPGMTHTNKWAFILKKQGYLGEDITALDTSERCTILHQMIGVYLLGQFNLEQKKKPICTIMFLLDKACEQGLFEALTTRLEHLQMRLENPRIDENKKLADKNTLFQDAERLGKLYKASGYLYAACIFLSIGNAYSNSPVENFGAIAKYYHETAAEFFYCGKILNQSDLPDNTLLSQRLFGEKGLTALGFATWDDAENAVTKNLTQITRDQLYDKAKETINSYLRNNTERLINS